MAFGPDNTYGRHIMGHHERDRNEVIVEKPDEWWYKIYALVIVTTVVVILLLKLFTWYFSR